MYYGMSVSFPGSYLYGSISSSQMISGRLSSDSMALSFVATKSGAIGPMTTGSFRSVGAFADELPIFKFKYEKNLNFENLKNGCLENVLNVL